MLGQALSALATVGSTAVVTAAGTDAWTGLRQALAHWFGRDDGQREQAELERLDRTATTLEIADAADEERESIRQGAFWQARIEALLENLDESERDQAADELRSLLTQHAIQISVSADQRGLAAGGNVDIRADGGSIAAGVIHGGARIDVPTRPDPSQG